MSGRKEGGRGGGERENELGPSMVSSYLLNPPGLFFAFLLRLWLRSKPELV